MRARRLLEKAQKEVAGTVAEESPVSLIVAGGKQLEQGGRIVVQIPDWHQMGQILNYFGVQILTTRIWNSCILEIIH